jgi:hypothetical protein
MKTYEVGDKIKLVKSHYLFNDWAVGKSGVVRKVIVNRNNSTYLIEINHRTLWVECHDLQQAEYNVKL